MNKTNKLSVREVFANIKKRVMTIGHGDAQILVCGDNEAAEHFLAEGRLNIVMAHQVISVLEKENPDILEMPMASFVGVEYELFPGTITPIKTDTLAVDPMETDYKTSVPHKRKCCKNKE